MTEERKMELQADIDEFKRYLDDYYENDDFETEQEVFFDTDEIIEWWDDLNADDQAAVNKLDLQFVEFIDDLIESKKEKEISL